MTRATTPLRVALALALVAAAPLLEPAPRLGAAEDPTPGATAAGVTGGADTGWLRGDANARFALVAKHLRGFDVAMVEVGYRYSELYWASRDRNWDYAAYQLGKIETAVANGIERRPKRAASAQMLTGAVAQVQAAIGARDRPALDAALGSLTASCNACHHAEQVAFIVVAPPTVRLAPVRDGVAHQAQPEGAVE